MKRIHTALALAAFLSPAGAFPARAVAQTAPAAVPQEAPRITGEELTALVKKGDVVIVDVRAKESFAGGHAEGAVNIPLGDVSTRMKELPKGKAIVAYCT